MDILSQKQRSREILKESLFLVSGAFLIYFFVFGTAYASGVFQLSFIEEFHRGTGITSLIGAIYMTALFEIGPVSSFLLNKYGCPVVVIIGALLVVCGLVGTAFSPNIYVAFICFGVITGSGNGLMNNACVSTAMVKLKYNRALCLGIAMAGGSLGGMITPALDNLLIHAYGWRGAMFILAAMNMHIILASELIWIALHLQERRKRKERFQRHMSIISNGAILDRSLLDKEEKSHDFPSLWKSPSFWAICFNNAFTFFGLTTILVHTSPYAVYVGMSSEMASLLLGTVGIGTFAGRLFWGFLMNHFKVNPSLAFQLGHLGVAITCAALTFWSNFIYMSFCLILFGFCLGAHAVPLFEILLSAVGEAQYAKAFGYVNCLGGIGNLLGAPCAGFLYDFTLVYGNSFYLGSAVIFAGVMCFFVPVLIQERKQITLKHNNSKTLQLEDLCIGLKFSGIQM